MTRSSARLTGLASAAALIAAVAVLMRILGIWEWEIFAIATILSAPLYISARDAAEERRPRQTFVPPWERTLAGTRVRR